MIAEILLGLACLYLLIVAIRLTAKLMRAPWTNGLGLLALMTFIKIKKPVVTKNAKR